MQSGITHQVLPRCDGEEAWWTPVQSSPLGQPGKAVRDKGAIWGREEGKEAKIHQSEGRD